MNGAERGIILRSHNEDARRWFTDGLVFAGCRNMLQKPVTKWCRGYLRNDFPRKPEYSRNPSTRGFSLDDCCMHSSQLRQRAPPAVGAVIRVVAQSVDTGRGRLSLALAT